MEVMVIGGSYARIRYWGNSVETPNFIDETFTLDSTDCYFGGKRYWFLCPTLKATGDVCGKRVAVLYKLGDYFGCRHCLELTYKSKKLRPGRGYYPIFRHKALNYKIEELEPKVRRAIYRNRLTRKARRLMVLKEARDTFWNQSMQFLNAYEKRVLSS